MAPRSRHVQAAAAVLDALTSTEDDNVATHRAAVADGTNLIGTECH